MSNVEQVAGARKRVNIGRRGMRYLKRQASKFWRRAARKDPEGAPRRKWYRGWAD